MILRSAHAAGIYTFYLAIFTAHQFNEQLEKMTWWLTVIALQRADIFLSIYIKKFCAITSRRDTLARYTAADTESIGRSSTH